MSQEDHTEEVELTTNERVDTKEFELPDTIFIRDIEDRVFQAIILQCLSKVEGISLLEGSFLDNFLGRGNVEGIKGISAEQNNKDQTINVKVEVNITYGIQIPEKADEIQSKITSEITKFTGLHVASVHVIFKNVLLPQNIEKPVAKLAIEKEETAVLLEEQLEEEFVGV